VVIDETMIPWRGKLLFKKYIPGKAHKYGVKIYKIAATQG
jgi:Transposase IS4